MGTHPIFESDFDCLTGMQSTRRVLSAGAKKGGKPMGTPGKSGFVTEMWAPFSRYWKGIKQARSEDVGLIPSVRGPLTRLMRDTFIKHGELVGEDARENSSMNLSATTPEQSNNMYHTLHQERRSNPGTQMNNLLEI